MIKIGDTLEEFKKGFASGEYKLREDEYLGDDGLPYCKKCKTRRFYCSDDKQWCIRSMCKCQEEARKKQEEEEAARKRMEEFNNRKALSLTGKRYRNLMFKDATITKHNSKSLSKKPRLMSRKAKRYLPRISVYTYTEIIPPARRSSSLVFAMNLSGRAIGAYTLTLRQSSMKSEARMIGTEWVNVPF